MTRLMQKIITVAVVFLLLPGTVLQMPAEQAQADHREVETDLADFVPSWAKEGGRSEMLKRFIDPELRPQIEKEIEKNVRERVDHEADLRFPEKGKTLEDYMIDFDRKKAGTGRALLGFLNFDYDSENTFYLDTISVKNFEGETAFVYDFKGENGDPWDPEAFGDDLFSYPSDPDAVRYSIEDNTGKIELDKREQGRASAYGKIAPNMRNLKNSEALMRFRVDRVGENQRLRFWVQSDKFSPGSSMPENGYGVELHLGKDEFILRGRENGKSTNLESMKANMTTDWHWLKIRASNNKVAVSLWSADEEEPEDWDMEYAIPESDQVSRKSLLSFVNHEKKHENIFYLDDMTVASHAAADPVFRYDFNGENGADWDSDTFDLLHSYPINPDGVTYSIQDHTGKIELGARQEDDCCSTYGKIAPHMPNLDDSDLLLRFRVDEVGLDQSMRAFVRADEFPSGISLPKNGYGIELNLQSDQLILFEMENSSYTYVDNVGANMTTDWHWLRLHVQGDELAVRLWKDGEDEPNEWSMVHEIQENVSAGEAVMRILTLKGNLKTVFTPSEEPVEHSVKQMKEQIMVFLDEGAITNDEAARHLRTHLTTVGHYEEKGFADKAVKHMKSFKKLLEHQMEKGFVTENAYESLKEGADDLISKWQ